MFAGPNKKYVILLKAINSKGDEGLDDQIEVQTKVSIGMMAAILT